MGIQNVSIFVTPLREISWNSPNFSSLPHKDMLKIIIDINLGPYAITFLTPPAKKQRSFSNAELSVVRRSPSSVVVNFSLKIFISQNCLITFVLLWHGALLGRYQCTVKIWIWLNHPKGQLYRSERSNLVHLPLGGNFPKNCFITISLFCHEASQGGC